jgi:hypothetical protein
MKITLSKSQWQMIGKKAGWMKKEATLAEQYFISRRQLPAKINVYKNIGMTTPKEGMPSFRLEVEIKIGGSTYQIPLLQSIPEVQELYDVLADQLK